MYYPILFVRQSGFLIPLSLFIIIFLAVTSIAMSRMTGGSKSSSVLEAISTQVFYAAESGAQLAMYNLFFDVTDRTTADSNCGSVNSMSDLSFTVGGLTGCTVDFSCSITNDASNTTSVYTVSAFGTCGSGEMTAQRTVALQAFMKD